MAERKDEIAKRKDEIAERKYEIAQRHIERSVIELINDFSASGFSHRNVATAGINVFADLLRDHVGAKATIYFLQIVAKSHAEPGYGPCLTRSE